MEKIDLVVPYVDSSDPNWVALFTEYNQNQELKEAINAENRFRGQNNFFRYFFRGIEKNLPWINNIFLLVQSKSQVPSWLDTTKIKVITHEQFIPKEYLPTFNSCTIELFLWNIPELSEKFIYTNDDFFILNKLKVSDFFEEDQVKINYYERESLKTVYNIQCNNSCRVIKKFNDLPKYYAFPHTFRPYIKSRMIACFNRYKKQLLESITMFRDTKNINCYVFLNHLLSVKKLVPSTVNSLYCDSATVIKKLKYFSENDIICLNDNSMTSDIYKNHFLNTYFDTNLPRKSKYERNAYAYNKCFNIKNYLK